jgi:hypothetical protein
VLVFSKILDGDSYVRVGSLTLLGMNHGTFFPAFFSGMTKGLASIPFSRAA